MLESQNKTNKQNHIDNLRHATVVARNSLFIVVGLAILKGIGGYVTNILPLIGDAVGSFSDIITGFAIFIGLKLSQQKASQNFKYGYHRIETFISLCISLVIVYAGGRIFMESLERFFQPVTTGGHGFGLFAAAISIVFSLFTYFYQRSIAQKINSTALLASAHDKRNDAVTSTGVFISVMADKFNVPYVESGVGILIAILILWTGIKYGKEALLYLLDYWDDPEVISQIQTLIQKSKIVTAIKNIRLRRAGTYIFGEAFLEINPFTDSKDLRDEIHRLDREIERSVEHLGDLVLYVNPPKPEIVRVAIPVSEENGLASIIAEDPTKAFRFFFVEIHNGGIRKFFPTENSFTIDQPTDIASFLKRQHTNILISSMIKPVLYYNLRLENIKVYPHFLDIKSVSNTVKLLLLDI